MNTAKGLLLGLALLGSRIAGAYTSPPTVPASSASGSYSVSWTAQCASGCFSQWLEEKVGSGSFVSVSSSSPAVFSGKPAGQYTYRLARLLGSYVPPYYMVPYYMTEYSAEVTVSVGAATLYRPAAVAAQLPIPDARRRHRLRRAPRPVHSTRVRRRAEQRRARQSHRAANDHAGAVRADTAVCCAGGCGERMARVLRAGSGGGHQRRRLRGRHGEGCCERDRRARVRPT